MLKCWVKNCFVFTLTVLAVGCGSSSTTEESPLTIGDNGPAGGVIFAMFDESGSSGLEVFPSAIGEAPWGCSGVNVEADNATRPTNGVGVPSGAESSEAIQTANTSGICFAEAAQLAFDFSHNGFDDWYLPSTDELITIRELGLLPGDAADGYWSATEDSAQNAFMVVIRASSNPLDAGEPSTANKTINARVIPVRSF